jgi:hypothetical protein
VTGMDRDALVARAKAVAVEVAERTRAGEPADDLIGSASWHELYALVLVLGFSADMRALASACASPDGEDRVAEGRRLRAAMAETGRLRRNGQPVPFALRVAESEYRAHLKAEKAAEGEAAAVPVGRRAA